MTSPDEIARKAAEDEIQAYVKQSHVFDPNYKAGEFVLAAITEANGDSQEAFWRKKYEDLAEELASAPHPAKTEGETLTEEQIAKVDAEFDAAWKRVGEKSPTLPDAQTQTVETPSKWYFETIQKILTCGLPIDEKDRPHHPGWYVVKEALGLMDEKFLSTSRELAEVRAILADGTAVHINMLYGTITKPTKAQMLHVLGDQGLATAEADRDRLKQELKEAKKPRPSSEFKAGVGGRTES